MSIKKQIVNKTRFIFVFVIGLLLIALIIQMLRIQLIDAKKYKEMATFNESRNMTVQADRGNILARDGRLLACSIPYFKLRYDCSVAHDSVFKKYAKPLSVCLAKYFRDAPASYYLKLLKNGRNPKRPNRYLLINRKELKYEELADVKQFPIFNLSKNKGGLIVEKIEKRIQPHLNLASRTIGDLYESSLSGVEGRFGLEGAYERDLKGLNGKGIQRKMIGSWIPFVTEEPIDGKDIVSTIDINFQDIAENVLLEQLKVYDAEAGSVVLMEVKTGAVRAIANLGRAKNGNYYEDKNYAVGEAIEYGSVFKLASMIALLEDGFVSPTDTVHTGNGRLKFYDRTMIDSHNNGYGVLTVQEAFEKSSNVGISKLVTRYYKKRPSDFVQRLYSMHLNEALGLPIHGEGKPLIKYPTDSDWYGTTLPWMSIGYEVHHTAMQILSLYNAVANNGVMLKPLFVEEIRDGSKVVKRMEKEIILPKLCSDKTLEEVKRMLEGVVERGTAISIKSSQYKIAGKTGTALISDGVSGYKDKKYIGSFVGYFPAENPVFSCIVTIKNPDKIKGFYGTTVAAPVFRALADKVYAQTYYLHPRKNDNNSVKQAAYFVRGKKDDLDFIANNLNMEFSNAYAKYDWVDVNVQKGKYRYSEHEYKDNRIPNLVGMTLKDAVYILENLGLRVAFSGTGIVRSQSLAAGQAFKNASNISLQLN